jgi:O-antigen ligase
MALLLLAALAVVVAFLGGSSNPRVPQLIGLRPLVALFLIPVIYYWRPVATASERTLLYLLLGLAGWMALQIVPLPSALWSQLPDREVIAELDAMVNLDPQWRPLSWLPARGVNALFGAIVPAVALLLALVLRASNQTLLQILLGVAVVNGGLAIIQVVSGSPDGLYLYSPRSSGSDGLFGNENHSGVFSAMGLLIAARLASRTDSRRQPWQQLIYGLAALLIFLAVLIGGSRAGLAAGVAAFAGSILMVALSSRNATARKSNPAPSLQQRSFIALAVVFLGSVAAIFFWLDRSPSLDGILNASALDDLRWDLNPIVWEMVRNNWLFGIGFGAFEEYYHIYEPTALLLPQYVNMAHNDWAQFLLEGGVVAAALLIGLLLWAGRQLSRIFRNGSAGFGLLVFWIAVAGVVGSASLVDYPLRTPIFQFAAIWLLLCLARDGAATEARDESIPVAKRQKSKAKG